MRVICHRSYEFYQGSDERRLFSESLVRLAWRREWPCSWFVTLPAQEVIKLVESEAPALRLTWGFPKTRGTFSGIPTTRTRVYYWGPHMFGNYRMGASLNRDPCSHAQPYFTLATRTPIFRSSKSSMISSLNKAQGPSTSAWCFPQTESSSSWESLLRVTRGQNLGCDGSSLYCSCPTCVYSCTEL